MFFVLSRESRAALVASFGVVKYLTLYGLIQCVGTALLFWVSVSCLSFISMLRSCRVLSLMVLLGVSPVSHHAPRSAALCGGPAAQLCREINSPGAGLLWDLAWLEKQWRGRKAARLHVLER